MLFNLKNSYTDLTTSDFILTKNTNKFQHSKPFLKILTLDSSSFLLHPLGFLDIVFGQRPKILPPRGGQLNIRKNQFYSFFYTFNFEILPKQNFLPNLQINFKQHIEFDNFQKFYGYFYGQKVFYFQYQLIYKKK